MAFGAGKYDALATLVRRKAMAQVAMVIVVNGNKGSGFATQMGANNGWDAALTTRTLAKALRHIADQMEKDALGMAQAAQAIPGVQRKEEDLPCETDDDEA